MRIPPVVVSLLLLTSATLSGQGLEYRIRMHMTIPGLPDGMPAPETTMFVDGQKIRVDNSTRGMAMSLIMDGENLRSYFLDHQNKTYREQEVPEGGISRETARDTAQLRALGMLPETITTTDKRTILGYETVRFVTVIRIPVPNEAGMVMLSVNESWIATDARLREAFDASLDAAGRILGPAASDMKALMPPGAQGVPLESNILMVKRAASDKPDVLALLKEENPAGLMSRVRMETIAVRITDIEDSLFRIPADYRKAN